MKYSFYCLLLIVSLFSCNKTETEKADNQLIFGYAYPFCSGNCFVIHRLTTDALFADDCDYCKFEAIAFQKTPLPDKLHEIARKLLDQIPAVLYDLEGEKTFGCPGCADGIIYYLELERDNVKHVYKWDDKYEGMPDEVKIYFTQVVETIEQLK